MTQKKPTTVEKYIAQFPETIQSHLLEMRCILQEVAPEAEETLKWGKPVFLLDTILFAYAAHKSHLSFVPTGPALSPYTEELYGYVVKKDSIQFSYEVPLPKELIQKIAKYRLQDVVERKAKWKY